MAQHRSRAIMAWLCIGVIALIAYGSLYPFNLKSDAGQYGLLAALKQLSWARAGRGDRVSNVLLYLPLGFCLTLWFDMQMRNRTAVLLATICGAMLSFAIEYAQVFISSRVPSFWDITLNTCGTAAGGIGGVAWYALTSRLPKSLRDTGGGGDRSALIVLLLWLGWRWAPFVPHFSMGKLKAALQPLFSPQFEWSVTVRYLVWWLVVAQVVVALTSAQRGVEMLLVLIAAVLVGRLFVVDQAFIPSELVALLLLLPSLVLLHRLRSESRPLLLFTAFAIIFAADYLSPFSLAESPAHFDLWPFIAWVNAGMPVYLINLLQALFKFAALFWLLTELGMSSRTANFLVPGTAIILEVSSLWMPGNPGSLTNPLLALAISWLMRYADSATPSRYRNTAFIRRRVRSR